VVEGIFMGRTLNKINVRLWVYFAGTDGLWPDVGQAVLSGSDSDDDTDSTLTWCYTEPRVITSLSTLPVPLATHVGDTTQAFRTVSLPFVNIFMCNKIFKMQN
jgi:hypothetical protein